MESISTQPDIGVSYCLFWLHYYHDNYQFHLNVYPFLPFTRNYLHDLNLKKIVQRILCVKYNINIILVFVLSLLRCNCFWVKNLIKMGKKSGLRLLHGVFNFLNIHPKRDTGLAKFRRPALAVAGNTICFYCSTCPVAN
jgi:hypothetical protein